jgi:putative protease
MAALAAGADAVYCGLKHFSARMEAKNFTLSELAGLTTLAHRHGVGVYIVWLRPWCTPSGPMPSSSRT